MSLYSLHDYASKFRQIADMYDGTAKRSAELTELIDSYTGFIMNPSNIPLWEELEQPGSRRGHELAAELREVSARCVSIMEKNRAIKVLGGVEEAAAYFANVESCIEQEFGSFHLSSDSKVVMIGSGAFPITPMLIGRQKNVEVLGLDIDKEAVELSNNVLKKLGSTLPIRLVTGEIHDFKLEIKAATHIIFSSTVALKYELLDRLHALTSKGVVVSMRYGNQLKSLFNYPMQPVDESKWRIAEQLSCPGQVFDVALYCKV
ncbi:nicotianamine synthase family protein [Paenibacillus sp. MMS20-IR301]|uniref:nicotianamine synthase family protein n=1 Tax=Paenibacillus sp. MMS20-IR301 TaxID=2895946 RepID=UPI0028F09AB6|nr:nicotianamine synthase family protein [Paenibacillus sp. MMS20-IR301]WNS46865.1 nicotianamine synthase family protein [Paenibacillus sp. MMS20-IR301]